MQDSPISSRPFSAPKALARGCAALLILAASGCQPPASEEAREAAASATAALKRTSPGDAAGVARDGEALRNAGPSAPFVDATQAVGPLFHHFNGMVGKLYFNEMVGPGGALADFDGDGDLDLFIVQGQPLGTDSIESALLPPQHPLPLTDRLYRNDLTAPDADGVRQARFTDVTEQSGLDSRGYGMGVASGDFDSDGHVDLYVTNFGPNRLLRGRGDGTFEDVTAGSGTQDDRWSVSAVFTDFDSDGRLDLFVANYVDYAIGTHKQCRAATGAPDYCGPHSYPPQGDRLFRNRGDGTFEDVTNRLGLDAAAGGGLGVVSSDFDGDGSLDLYVANDGSANHLWMRSAADPGKLTEQALLRGAALNRDGHAEAGMGVDAGDFDNDGDEDIFLSHLTQETNTLYRNQGNGTFDDVTSTAGLGTPSWDGTGFGAGFLDFDNDGWLDVLIVNGAVRVLEPLRRAGEILPLHQPDQLYRNRGDGTFELVDGGEAFEQRRTGRGLLFGDLDNDGDTDAVVLNNGGEARTLINAVGQDRPWLGLRVLTAEGRDALGARVRLEREEAPPLFRTVRTGGSYASARDSRLLFGLGEAPRATRAVVAWPGGRQESFAIGAVRRYQTLRLGEGQPTGDDDDSSLAGSAR
ncbi:MAG: CRTAC1 family protein [Acidobacteriota bacterium]